MKEVRLTVNGEPLTTIAPARTQLAELLRDHFHLTGTHLGCEQGVCGACTVVVDGVPVRACISYTHACDGAEVITVEGLQNDPTAAALRTAFSRHHALQCGFCTPGMLITARDIVLRGIARDSASVRHELSGNLCRCTGYMGLVAAVTEVAQAQPQRAPASVPTAAALPERKPVTGPAFVGFDVDPRFITTPGPVSAAVTAADTDGWTSFRRVIPIPHPANRVWSLLADLEQVTKCIPGVRLTRVEGDHFEGESSIRFGPVTATFDGQGNRRLNPLHHAGSITAHGVDPNGQTSLEVRFEFALESSEAPSTQAQRGPSCDLSLKIRFRIQGHLAQFNRPELIESFADVLLGQFADNCDRVLRGEVAAARNGLSGLGLLWKVLLLKLFGPRRRN